MNGLEVLGGLIALAVLCVIGVVIAEGFMMILGTLDYLKHQRENIKEEKETLLAEIKRIENDS